MADTSGIPSLPVTTDLGAAGGAPIEGDPLEAMQKVARDAIDSINRNPIFDANNKIDFKKYVLHELKARIDQMNQIDKDFAVKKAEEEAASTDEAKIEEDEDPFADIFGDDVGTPDESTQEKGKIAQEFISIIKRYKEKFIKDLRVKKEAIQKQTDDAELDNLLGKLDSV